MKIAGTSRKILAVLFWLCIWQLLAAGVHNQILLVGPVEVVLRVCQDVRSPAFWQTVITSAWRIAIGFLGAFVLGSLFGILAYRYRWVKELLAPLMSAVISVPVASFAVILLIWFGSGRLSIWIAFLITFPNLYFQVLEGMGSTDAKLLELARVYHMPLWNQAWYLYRPALAPFIKSGCRVSIGMAWKSGVAAEVIGLPERSIGEQIYMSKIYLDTVGVLSWTMVCVLLSVLVEKIFLFLLNQGLEMKVPMVRKHGILKGQKRTASTLHLQGLSKTYGDHVVLKHIDAELIPGKIYALMEPSGSGKTTLFRILCGLESFEEGDVFNEGKRTMVSAMAFQDNRFFKNLTAAENLELVCDAPDDSVTDDNRSDTHGNGPDSWRERLKELLPVGELYKPMSQYSGGMARRVEVIRCMLSDADLLLLDEPFGGLDEKAKAATAAFIRKYQGERIIMIATHSAEDIALLRAEKMQLH